MSQKPNPPPGTIAFPLEAQEGAGFNFDLYGKNLDLEAMGLFVHRGFTYEEGANIYQENDPTYSKGAAHLGIDITAMGEGESGVVFDSEGNLIPSDRYDKTVNMPVYAPENAEVIFAGNRGGSIMGAVVLRSPLVGSDGEQIIKDGEPQYRYHQFFHLSPDSVNALIAELGGQPGEEWGYNPTTPDNGSHEAWAEVPAGFEIGRVEANPGRGTHLHYGATEAGQDHYINRWPWWYGNVSTDPTFEDAKQYANPADMPYVVWNEAASQWVAMTNEAATVLGGATLTVSEAVVEVDSDPMSVSQQADEGLVLSEEGEQQVQEAIAALEAMWSGDVVTDEDTAFGGRSYDIQGDDVGRMDLASAIQGLADSGMSFVDEADMVVDAQTVIKELSDIGIEAGSQEFNDLINAPEMTEVMREALQRREAEREGGKGMGGAAGSW